MLVLRATRPQGKQIRPTGAVGVHDGIIGGGNELGRPAKRSNGPCVRARCTGCECVACTESGVALPSSQKNSGTGCILLRCPFENYCEGDAAQFFLLVSSSHLVPKSFLTSSTFFQASSFLAVNEARARAYSASGRSNVVMNGQPPELTWPAA